MDVSDWRAVSQHYVQELVTKAVLQQKLDSEYKPTLLIAASEDALAVARILRDLCKSGSDAATILTEQFKVYDPSAYNWQHTKPWTGSFNGQRVLVVDKADNSRATLSKFILEVQTIIEQHKAGTTSEWQEPQLGVFVLHNKRRPKAADLPMEVLHGRYFVGEESENVCIAYPFNTHDSQPTATGQHASGTHPGRRKSWEQPVRRPTTPPPNLPATANRDTVRSMSSHYVETILEAAVEKQKLMERFHPTMLVAASDGALPAARLLRNYLTYRAATTDAPVANGSIDTAASGSLHENTVLDGPLHELPLLTPRLELYDEDRNPYMAFTHPRKAWGAASLAGQRILIVDKADDTRASLVSFITQLQASVESTKSEVLAASGSWAGDPVLGVFVLHRKNVIKQADLPPDILADRYFYCEEAENVLLAYPFNTSNP